MSAETSVGAHREVAGGATALAAGAHGRAGGSLPEWYQRTQRTWIDVFIEQTARHADREFVKGGGRRLTYGELRAEVDRLACGLLRAGVRPGSTVALWMNSCLEWVVAQWAVYRTGSTLLPLYSYYKPPEVLHALEEARPAALIVRESFIGKIDARAMVLEMLPELAESRSPRFAAAPSLQVVITVEDWRMPGTRSLAEVAALGEPISEEALEFARQRTSPFDVMNLMYTSGTTGFPKAGLSMHRNNMATVHLWAERAGLDGTAVLLCQVPLFTNFGCLYGSALTMYVGGRMVVTERFDAEESLREVAAERVTYVPGTPEMFRMLLDHPRFPSADVSSVRGGHVAGSALEPELARRIITFAPAVMQAYGMSECGGLSTTSGAEDTLDDRLHSVGRPLPSARVEIRDPTTGQPVPNGEAGEIWLGDALPGSCVGKGYLASPFDTANAMTPDGWFRTGDLGRFDERGYLFFTGRVKNMLTVGGFNVYPAEIERVLEQIEGVRRAHVVGVPDARLGSVAAAFVVLDRDVDIASLRATLGERLSSQKIPRHIWPIREEEIPMTPSGKVRIVELEERAQRLSSARP